ncbi:MAG TPA: alpha-L-fucosidase [Polyangiaceae bacterium]|jgi:alpha-L-fucosidase|nr:alpha-L-fucosidase [Polyangiaceae bacterium]
MSARPGPRLRHALGWNPREAGAGERELQRVLDKGPFAPTWSSLQKYQMPAWFRDAKFGIFIHWGVYSVPAFANEWYSRNMYQPGSREFLHHRATYGDQTKFGYKDFIPRFTASQFEPKKWADLFRRAGARYIVPVGEHHEGFQMYESALSSWNALEMGPHRDVLGELNAAFTDAGLIFGTSSHRAEHFWFMDGGRLFDSDVQDPDFADFYGPAQPGPKEHFDRDESPPTAEFVEDWQRRTQELIDAYRPRSLYFDWWIQHRKFEQKLREIAAYYYNRAAEWGTEVVINYKLEGFAKGAAVFGVERGQLAGIQAEPWQTDTSISKSSWCYVEDQEYKTARELICDLIDIVSKNGSMLLNVGPRADGLIAPQEEQVLLDMGAWLAQNGAAIYGSRPFRTFGEGPTQAIEGQFSEGKRSGYVPGDYRFTRKGDEIYAFALSPPEDGRLSITSLGTRASPEAISSVELLGAGPVAFQRDAEALHVELGAVAVRALPAVLKIQ